MKFNVAFIGENIVLKEDNQNIKSYGTYYWLRNLKQSDLKSKGVKIASEIEDATKFIQNNNGDGIYQCQYLIVNIETKSVYYKNYGRKDLKIALLSNFELNIENITFEVDIDQLQSISELRIQEYSREQQSLIDPNYTSDSIAGMFAEGTPFSTQRIYKYTEGTIFKKDAIKRFNEYKQDKNTKITMKGFDEHGNDVIVSDKIISLVDLGIKYKNIDEENRISIQTIIDEIDKLNKNRS